MEHAVRIGKRCFYSILPEMDTNPGRQNCERETDKCCQLGSWGRTADCDGGTLFYLIILGVMWKF